MQRHDPLLYTLVLEDAIDRHPLVVPPDTPLVSAIALMSQVRGNCPVADRVALADPIPTRRSSCVLVMQDRALLGIVTERDIVRLTAAEQDFSITQVSEVMVSPVIALPISAFRDIFAALFLFRRYRIRHLAIVDESGQLIGMVSPESIRGVMKPANLLKLRRVAEVMTPHVIHAPPNTSVLNLARLMAERRVSCIAIAIEHRQSGSAERDIEPVGIVTERDIVQMQSLQLNLSETKAEDVMSTPLFLLSPEDSLWTAHQEMLQRHVRRLLVAWNWGRGLGIVTQTSLLRVFDPLEMSWVIETLQRTIEQRNAETDRLLQVSGIDSPTPTDPNDSEQSLLFLYTELRTLLSGLRGCLEQVVNESDTAIGDRQGQLTSALIYLDRLDEIVSAAPLL
jgi:CBS domain-containing protein